MKLVSTLYIPKVFLLKLLEVCAKMSWKMIRGGGIATSFFVCFRPYDHFYYHLLQETQPYYLL